MNQENDVQGPVDVLIAGAGVAGLEAAFGLQEMAGERVRVRLLTPADEFVYRPMTVAEPFTSGWARHYPLSELAAEGGAELVPGRLTEVDPKRRRARTDDGRELAYDALLVCPGAKQQSHYEHATTVDDARMDEVLHGVVQDVEEGYVKRLAIVVPTPMPWPLPAYELALMCSERAWDMQTELTVTVLTPEEAPLAAFGKKASLALSQLLADRRIDVVTSAHCAMPKAKTVTVTPGGRTFEFDRAIALPQLGGPALQGLPHDADGFIPVDQFVRVRGADRVWAAGDASDFPIKHGGVAAQMADTAAQGIAALAGTRAEPPAFDPVLEGVLLTGGTPQFLHGRPTGGHGDESELVETRRGAEEDKLVARYLAPHLGEQAASRIT